MGASVPDRLPLKFTRAFTAPKRDDTPNEDCWFASEDGLTVAMSDGASVSYDPAPWAALLVRNFVITPHISGNWIDATLKSYQSGYDRENMEWMQQAAFDRGSFATLLGVECAADGKSVRVFALGDTLLVFADGHEVVRTLPYVLPDEFDASPSLLSTSALENRIWCDKILALCWYELNISSHEAPQLLLMTDALGRWMLDRPSAESLAALMEIADEEAFRRFVEYERQAGRMRRDDTTLVVLG
jgi:hypothetical protein